MLTPIAGFLFLTLKSWFYSCMQPANIAITLAKATPQRQRKPILQFSLVKNFSSFLPCEKTIWLISICAVYYISILFSNLVWRNLSAYINYKPTCIHTHFKNFGPSKSLPFSKYATKISSAWLLVWDTTIMSIKLKTGQVSTQIIHVGSWTNNTQLSIQVHHVVSLQDCCLEKKSRST